MPAVNDLYVDLVGIGICSNVIAWFFYILFGQVTVRRLRKNPATKHELGIEFVSGADILNVAETLTVPRWFTRRIRNSPKVGWMQADADLLYQHTNRFDRILARVTFVLFMLSNFGLITLMILYFLGVFN